MSGPGEIRLCTATSRDELAAAHEIRRRVFTDEQSIPSGLDLDGLDADAVHVLALCDDEPVATGRLVGETPERGVLARIAVLPTHRRFGLGSRIVAELEREAAARGLLELELHPHAHLEPFYARLGYETAPGRSVAGNHELITMRKSLRP